MRATSGGALDAIVKVVRRTVSQGLMEAPWVARWNLSRTSGLDMAAVSAIRGSHQLVHVTNYRRLSCTDVAMRDAGDIPHARMLPASSLLCNESAY